MDEPNWINVNVVMCIYVSRVKQSNESINLENKRWSNCNRHLSVKFNFTFFAQLAGIASWLISLHVAGA